MERTLPRCVHYNPAMLIAGKHTAARSDRTDVQNPAKAAAAAGTDDGAAVMAKMKELPTNDPLFVAGKIRADGRKVRRMSIHQVKIPEESKYPYDFYKPIATIPEEEAFRPIFEGTCPFFKTER